MTNLSTTDILNAPQPTREKRQRGLLPSDVYFTRIVPVWSQPTSLTPNQWRAWSANQPVASLCKETMGANLTALDWKITPRKSDQRDELRGTIDYYERFFMRAGNSGLDWVGFLEWFLADLLDLPFGTGWEIGRKGDEPGGRAAWLEPMDGGTLFPTNNKDYPVMQYYNNFSATFPAHAVARAYMSPRTEIERKGWGIAPPEKAFLAMEMLARGDRYYANLLLDIPPVGILDLMDVTWDDAQTWVESFRTFANGGGDGFKIPVLAEHTGKAEFIPLGKDPNQIMYESITLKYAALVTAAYGMTLSDIGLQGSSASGETLAGAIRGEQKTNRTGKAKNKAKIKYFIETILPHTLQFEFIDTDGERLAMIGRARLANATAMNAYHQMAAISPTEARLQAIQDGLFTISMPEEPPPDAKPPMPTLGKKPAERPASVGSPQPPSLGGDGEVKKSLVTFKPENLDQTIENIVNIVAPSVFESLDVDDPAPIRTAILESVFSDDGLGNILNGMVGRVGQFEFGGLEEEVESILLEEGLSINTNLETLKSRIQDGFASFIVKAIVYNMAKSDLLLSTDSGEDFVDLATEVKRNINKSLPDYISAHIGIEVQNIIEELKAQELDLPEPIRVRSFSRQSPMSVVVNPPNISMPNISLPPITVNVPERSMNVESPVVNVNPSPITVESPTVNVSVPERSVQVNVPEMSPVFNLESQAPVVNVSVPESQTVVNVQNEVNPTPVQIDVNVPAPKDKRITIVKQGDVWTGEAESKEE